MSDARGEGCLPVRVSPLCPEGILPSVASSSSSSSLSSAVAPKTTAPKRRFLWVSPVGMLVCAGVIALGYGLSYLLGMRAEVSVLFATANVGSFGSLIGAAFHVLLYLGFIVLVPTLILAAGIFAVFAKIDWHRVFKSV